MTVVLQLDPCQDPFGCKWFAFGPAFQDLAELFLTKFADFLGVVVKAGLVQLMNQF
jgi:hypothetical protein